MYTNLEASQIMEDTSRKLTRQRKLFWGFQDSKFYGGGHSPDPQGDRSFAASVHSAKLSIWTPKFQILAKTLTDWLIV